MEAVLVLLTYGSTCSLGENTCLRSHPGPLCQPVQGVHTCDLTFLEDGQCQGSRSPRALVLGCRLPHTGAASEHPEQT